MQVKIQLPYATFFTSPMSGDIYVDSIQRNIYIDDKKTEEDYNTQDLNNLWNTSPAATFFTSFILFF